MSRTRAGVVVGLALVTAACGLGGVPQQALPEDPIAISYRTQEEARRRAEEYEDSQGGLAPSTQARPRRAGYGDLVASDENVAEIFDRLFGRGPEDDDRHLGRLALLNPRTSEVEVVVAARRGAIPLAWSPDHTRLLFAQPQGGDFQVYEYARADETVRQVTLGPPSHTQACYASDGRLVLAVVDTRARPVNSYLAITGPGGATPLRRLTEGPADHSPACVPGRDQLVFVRELAPPRAELFVLDLAAGGSPRRLSPGRHPRFSADGEWVAYAAPHQRELRIWRIRPDGTGRAPIGRSVRHEARPAVSPDGSLVAYVAAEERPRRHLYLRRFDGSGDRILFADGDGEFPVW